MKEQEPKTDQIGGFYASEERLNRIALWKGRLAVRSAFESMMQLVDSGEADRDETIAAMSSVMMMINGYGQ